MRQPQEENKGKENNFFENTADGYPVMTSAEVCSTKKNIRKSKKRRHSTTESNGNLSRVPKDISSPETNAASLTTSPQSPAQHPVDPVMSQSQVENAAKEKNVLKNPIDESPAMTSSKEHLGKKEKNKRKRERRRERRREVSGNICERLGKNVNSLTVSPQNPAQHPVDPVMSQSQVENAAKEKNVLKNPIDESPAITSSKEHLGKKEKNKRKRERRRERRLEVSGNICERLGKNVNSLTMSPQNPAQHPVDPVMSQSQVENAAKEKNVLKSPIDESPAMTSSKAHLGKKEKNKRKRERRREVSGNICERVGKNVEWERWWERIREVSGNISGVPKEAFSTEISTSELAMPSRHSAQNSLDPAMRQSQVENAAKLKNVLKNAVDESPAMTSASPKCSKGDVDLSGIPKDNFFPETSISALDMLPQHQVQFSMDPAVRHSHEVNEGNAQNLIEKAVDGSSAMASEEVYSRRKNKKRKRPNTKCYDTECGRIDFSLSEVSKDTISSETYPTPLDAASQYPAPHLMDPVMTQHQEENEVKGHNMSEKSIDRSSAMTSAEVNSGKKNKIRKRQKSGNNAIQSNSNFQNEFVPEVVKLNAVQGNTAHLSLVSKQDDCCRLSHFSLGRSITSHSKKKLLVLDLNGLLADFVLGVPKGYKPDCIISRKAVFRRPFCEDFLQFCFDRFHVGVWSSRARKNVSAAVDFLVRKSASKLLFCWDRSQCTKTKFYTIEDKKKPLVLKELSKLWKMAECRRFNQSNTLLLDDSPYKALRNPMHTAIFPYSYQYNHTNDTSLGPGGDIRVYLEGLAMAEDVQEYVASHPFGQPAITKSHPHWHFYQQLIDEESFIHHYHRLPSVTTTHHWLPPSPSPTIATSHLRPPPSATIFGHHHHRSSLSNAIGHHRRPPAPATTISHNLWQPPQVTTTGHHLRLPPPSPPSAITTHHCHWLPPSANISGHHYHRHQAPPSTNTTTTGYHHPPSPSTTIIGHHLHPEPPSTTATGYHCRPPQPATILGHHHRLPPPVTIFGHHQHSSQPPATIDHHHRPLPLITISGHHRRPPPPSTTTTAHHSLPSPTTTTHLPYFYF